MTAHTKTPWVKGPHSQVAPDMLFVENANGDPFAMVQFDMQEDEDFFFYAANSHAGLVAFREKVETTVARYDVEEISERCAIVLIRQALAAAGEGE
jgi:hypothetical protein